MRTDLGSFYTRFGTPYVIYTSRCFKYEIVYEHTCGFSIIDSKKGNYKDSLRYSYDLSRINYILTKYNFDLYVKDKSCLLNNKKSVRECYIK